jgi:hypothetical protein
MEVMGREINKGTALDLFINLLPQVINVFIWGTDNFKSILHIINKAPKSAGHI